MLDAMVRDGRLELDIDERSGEIFYEVRTAAQAARAKAAAPSGPPAVRAALESGRALVARVSQTAAVASAVDSSISGGELLAPEKRRKIMVGVLPGALLPGFGLACSAQWPVV